MEYITAPQLELCVGEEKWERGCMEDLQLSTVNKNLSKGMKINWKKGK